MGKTGSEDSNRGQGQEVDIKGEKETEREEGKITPCLRSHKCSLFP